MNCTWDLGTTLFYNCSLQVQFISCRRVFYAREVLGPGLWRIVVRIIGSMTCRHKPLATNRRRATTNGFGRSMTCAEDIVRKRWNRLSFFSATTTSCDLITQRSVTENEPKGKTYENATGKRGVAQDGRLSVVKTFAPERRHRSAACASLGWCVRRSLLNGLRVTSPDARYHKRRGRDAHAAAHGVIFCRAGDFGPRRRSFDFRLVQYASRRPDHRRERCVTIIVIMSFPIRRDATATEIGREYAVSYCTCSHNGYDDSGTELTRRTY